MLTPKITFKDHVHFQGLWRPGKSGKKFKEFQGPTRDLKHHAMHLRPVERAHSILCIFWVLVLNERKPGWVPRNPDALQTAVVTERPLNLLLLRLFRQVADVYFALGARISITARHSVESCDNTKTKHKQINNEIHIGVTAQPGNLPITQLKPEPEPGHSYSKHDHDSSPR